MQSCFEHVWLQNPDGEWYCKVCHRLARHLFACQLCGRERPSCGMYPMVANALDEFGHPMSPTSLICNDCAQETGVEDVCRSE